MCSAVLATIARIVLPLFFATPGATQPFPLPDDPPRASLIQVSLPNAAGDVTVVGRPGAVSANNFVILVTMDTGHFAHTRAAADGSFDVMTFAPYGTSIMVKADPTGETLNRALQEVQNSVQGSLTAAHATIVRVSEPPPTAEGVSFGGAGLPFGPASVLPAWTFQGVISNQQVVPGGVIRVQGTIRVHSPVVAMSGTIRTNLILDVQRLSGPDGMGTVAASAFASTLLTPTGLPVEKRSDVGSAPSQGATVTLAKVAPERAEAPVDVTLTLPNDLPAGYYRPSLTFLYPWEGLTQENPRSRPTIVVEVLGIRRRDQIYLPIVRVGNPAPPRLYWTLLTDTLSNGTRGTGAVEDQNHFGLATRILTQSEKFIIPRLDPTSGQPLTYRLEPFAPTISRGTQGFVPSVPLIPFRFPSGRLTVRVQQPDGSIRAIGPAPFVQARQKTLVDQNGDALDKGGGHLTDVFQLSTMDPSFEVPFTQDGLHVITLDGAVDDIWGNTWVGGGTYEVYVARMLSLDTAVLPGTPFEVGDVFAPGLVITPPTPASVEVRFRLLPNSESAQAVERTIRGFTNRFGYFQPPGGGVLLEQAGEYRVDTTASFRDSQGDLWMGSRTWGGVVAPRNPALIAHGRRGIDDLPEIGPQWFFRNQTTSVFGSGHVFYPFHTGDITWQERSDAVLPMITIQDTGTAITELLRARGISAARATAGEMPLFLYTSNNWDAHVDPSKVDLWGYSYRSVQRPLVRVREEITTDGLPSLYWRFRERYANQIGMGPGGDLLNDIKFQYGAAVLRGPAMPRPEYAIYGSLFVLVPDTNNPRGGTTRTMPPFQGNGAGPSGGPVMTLKGRDIDLFIHLTGIRPGSVLEVGDNFAIAGAVGSTLPALVATKVTTPSGQTRQFSGRANRVGYYYRPQDDFAVTEPGIYTVDVRVTFDGRTSAGPVTEPFPTGDVLGSANGRFFVYVVPRDSPILTVDLPETMTVAAPGQLDITARAPAGQTLTSGHVTTMMPGFLLQTNQLTAAAGALSYRYEPATLARDFPNLDLDPPADVITLSLFGQTTNAQGQPSYAARMLVLHGQEFFNLTHTRPPARTVASVSAASFSGATLSSESIVAAFGTGLAERTQGVASLSLPTSLAGTTITIKDSAGTERLAPLFFVSPGQINYQMPPGTTPGPATVTITNRYGDVSVGMVQIVAVAPGLFAANANGQGVAAALALRVKADGTQQFESVSRFDPSQNKFVSVPIDLGPETDQVFLILFGTGTRFRISLSTVSATIGGVGAPVLFAGAQGDFVGLDQINLQIPRSLVGRGEVEILVTADGQQANPVTINIK